MKLQDMVPGGKYSWTKNGKTYKGVYFEWFEADKVTRKSSTNMNGDECVEIQVENPKGGEPLGYKVPLSELKKVK